MNFRKDESLDRLAEVFNVAQFVSYAPGAVPRQAYARVLGYEPNHQFATISDAVGELLARSAERTVNVRSFLPDDPRSHEFIYGLSDRNAVVDAVRRIAAAGFHVIVNETIDVSDGGVSGVLEGGIMEFAPDDTPRCVEKPGVASLPRRQAIDLLQLVYGFPVDIGFDDDFRLEFSIHPRPCGWKHTHVIGWELERVGFKSLQAKNAWPNAFSRHVGDKAFGLMMAMQAGVDVPYTTVIGRRVAPFSFGCDTGSSEWWIRTCPKEQVPGKYTTHHGWLDPFRLLAEEDPEGSAIASVLSQRGVRAQFSGALIVDASGKPVIEGKRGEGEDLMLGIRLPEQLPQEITADVLSIFSFLRERLGPVRFEWVHDGRKVWIVQLHRGATQSAEGVLVPGEAKVWNRFYVSTGLNALRSALETLPESEGIVLVGEIGLTSHIADVVRKAGKPARNIVHDEPVST
ncbi:hypothetical protein PPMP20_33255 [Paraburkholderia phymatum]|uniref:Uncharacterized protein n=1 Tax=Paraburkholderia phymatum (strain DSM 17167 / CIP 108236 / LMG 21445 / STM815) TaxID=391038 RepID=B2JLA1_PARP8|nr:hypothetical protein [Paraburkholderia phymatum]ACC74069.1 conserved hypothetical protein [Paraburkholderia phymatum STM815]